MNRWTKRTRGIIAMVGIVSAAVATVGITPSLAGWTRQEYVHGAASTLDCGSTGSFNTQAWGQMIAGGVAGHPLDSHLAGLLGVTTTSGNPHSSASGGSGSGVLSYLGNDAWASDLAIGALNSIDLGAGVTIPLGADLGADTQYARATRGGLAIGASGALTSLGGGAVELSSPTSATPGTGSLSLGTALSATIGKELAGRATQLANASVSIGALGSTAQLDSCAVIWQKLTEASAVARNYVLAKLGMQFTSSLVSQDLNTAVTGAVGTLGTTLNGLQTTASNVVDTTVNGALTGVLGATSGIVSLTQGGPTAVKVGVTFDMTPVLALLNSTIGTGGPVTINLHTGEIDVNLAALGGFASLNGLPANTNLLGSHALSNLTADVVSLINTFLTTTVNSAITAAITAAHVQVSITTSIHAVVHILVPLSIDVATVDVEVAGSLGQFLQPATNGVPTVSVTKTDVLGVSDTLSALGINLDGILSPVITALTSSVTGTIVPALVTDVLTPLLSTATSAASTAVTNLATGTLVSGILTSLGGVVTVIGHAIDLTVNAQPDAAGPVGSPEATTSGEYFESALHIGVLDTVDNSSALSLFFGSSAVGPNS